jgi:hypothetical protein
MSDSADDANETMMLHMDAILRVTRDAAKVCIPLEWHCRECDAPTNGARWCSADCCKVWQARTRNLS